MRPRLHGSTIGCDMRCFHSTRPEAVLRSINSVDAGCLPAIDKSAAFGWAPAPAGWRAREFTRLGGAAVCNCLCRSGLIWHLEAGPRSVSISCLWRRVRKVHWLNRIVEPAITLLPEKAPAWGICCDTPLGPTPARARWEPFWAQHTILILARHDQQQPTTSQPQSSAPATRKNPAIKRGLSCLSGKDRLTRRRVDIARAICRFQRSALRDHPPVNRKIGQWAKQRSVIYLSQMAEAMMTEVTEREAATMYARACAAWYGRRALSIIKETIKHLRSKNDESGVRIWTLVAEALPDTRARRPIAGRPRVFE